MKTNLGVSVVALAVAVLPSACSVEAGGAGGEDEAALGAVGQELKGGVQSFAQIDSAGAVVPGSLFGAASTITVTHPSTGAYSVSFDGIAPALPLAPGDGGTVQVVSTGVGSARCTLSGPWTFSGGSIQAGVRCRTPGGALTNSGFFIQYGRAGANSGDAAYTVVSASGSVSAGTTFNSSGSSITVTHGGVGVYYVFINSTAPLENGAIQVTALSGSSHCNPGLREYLISQEIVTVSCFDNAGAHADAPFALNYAGTNSLARRGVGAFSQVSSAGALDARYTHSACPLGSTVVTRTAVGNYQITRTLVGSAPLSQQVSAFGDTAAHCKVEDVIGPDPAGSITLDVACYSSTGSPVDSGFVESFATNATPASACGGCAHDCQGGACVLGMCQPVTLATGVTPTSVAANSTDVYWTNSGVGPTAPRIMSVPRGGGTAVTRVAGGVLADSIVLDSSHVFWTQASGTIGVLRSTLSGGSVTSLATASSPATPQPHGLLRSGSTLYWASNDTSQIYRISTSAVGKTPLLTAIMGPNWYPFSFTMDASKFYFIRDSGTRLLSVPKTGGTPVDIASMSGSTIGIAQSALATDGTYVYFASDKEPGFIFKVPTGGGTRSVFTIVSGVVTAMLIDAGTLFWTTQGPGTVMSAPLSGAGPLLTLASGQNKPNNLFIDSTTIFWSNADSVRKVAR